MGHGYAVGTLVGVCEGSADGDADSVMLIGLASVGFSVVGAAEGVRVGTVVCDDTVVGLPVDRAVAEAVG